MNTYIRNQHRARAVIMFEAEEREQQLASIALSQAATLHVDAVTHYVADPNVTAALGLHGIVQATEKNILNAHRQIQTARSYAASMAAADPELARLQALINGAVPVSAGNVIEGEAIEVSSQSVEHPPNPEYP